MKKGKIYSVMWWDAAQADHEHLHGHLDCTQHTVGFYVKSYNGKIGKIHVFARDRDMVNDGEYQTTIEVPRKYIIEYRELG